MYIASLIDHDEWPAGWVASGDDGLRLAIVCHRIHGEWVPQYAVIREEGNGSFHAPLPSCFALDSAAADTLEGVYVEETSA